MDLFIPCCTTAHPPFSVKRKHDDKAGNHPVHDYRSWRIFYWNMPVRQFFSDKEKFHLYPGFHGVWREARPIPRQQEIYFGFIAVLKHHVVVVVQNYDQIPIHKKTPETSAGQKFSVNSFNPYSNIAASATAPASFTIL